MYHLNYLFPKGEPFSFNNMFPYSMKNKLILIKSNNLNKLSENYLLYRDTHVMKRKIRSVVWQLSAVVGL